MNARFASMSKRRKFIITAFILSLGFVGVQFLGDQYKFLAIGGLSILTAVLFAWSLIEGLGRNMTLVSLILPSLFTLGVGLFWFLLPSNIFLRLPLVIVYGLGIFALVSSQNIFVVAAVTKSIPLLRTARGIGFVLTLLTSFLIFDAIISLRIWFLLTALLTGASAFPIFLQGLWQIPLEIRPSRQLLRTSLIFSVIVAELTLSLYFWPVTVAVGSLFLTVAVYILLGLGQSLFESRLFAQTVREYLVRAAAVLVGLFLGTRWGA